MESKHKDKRDDIAFVVLSNILSPSTQNEIKESIPLLVNEYSAMRFLDVETALWRSRYSDDATAATTPPTESRKTIILRLPKSHSFFDFLLSGCASVAENGATLYVYGHKDEGIKGASEKLKQVFGNCETVDYKKRVRVLKCAITSPVKDFALSHFRKCTEVEYDDDLYDITSYPGMFNDGDIDDASRLLLDQGISFISPNTTLLDYGTGTGILTKIIRNKFPTITSDVLDYDALSLEAAKINLKGEDVRYILHDSLVGCATKKYNVIISNPPIHTAKEEQFETLHTLIKKAPQYLSPDGKLIIVTQTRVKLEGQFTSAFADWSKLAETPRFTVWIGLT